VVRRKNDQKTSAASAFGDEPVERNPSVLKDAIDRQSQSRLKVDLSREQQHFVYDCYGALDLSVRK
jgi:hypothetical protein